MAKSRFLSCAFGACLQIALALVFCSAVSAQPRGVTSPACSDTNPSAVSIESTAIESPAELASRKGELRVTLRLKNFVDPAGETHYCYMDEHGNRSPTLRVRPGDVLVVKLINEVSGARIGGRQSPGGTASCKSSMMMADGTNLHFHGLNLEPVCHGDETLRTSIPPSSKPFLYRVRIPRDQPPGLYWYHPHPHGHSEEQVLGGASGALIVEGIAERNPVVAGLPERVLVLRDQPLSARAAGTAKVPSFADAGVTSPVSKGAGSADASLANVANERDPTRPAKDLSVNFAPVIYPDYAVPTIRTRARTREFWRVLNASADTYVNLGVLFNGEWQGTGLVAAHGSWQRLGLVALDGYPIAEATDSSEKANWKTEILIPPGGRAEFIVDTVPEGTKAELITVGAQTNPPVDEDADPGATAAAIPDNDDNTPPRPLARIVSSLDTVEPKALSEGRVQDHTYQEHAHQALAHQDGVNADSGKSTDVNKDEIARLAGVAPVRQRRLYFSEKVTDAKHPATSTVFFITEEGHEPKAFNAAAMAPDIVVHRGEVEDWTIENRSTESHAFHIHQLHFLLLERDGEAAGEKYFLDTVDVPYWDGVSAYPSVKLRMDFRGANVVGIFPYHCHILQHVDGGMMGLIEVRK